MDINTKRDLSKIRKQEARTMLKFANKLRPLWGGILGISLVLPTTLWADTDTAEVSPVIFENYINDLRPLIEAGINGDQTLSGARAFLRGKKLETVGLADAYRNASERGLSILIAKESVKSSGAQVERADAAFDVRFGTSFAFAWSQSYSRTHILSRWYEDVEKDQAYWDALEVKFKAFQAEFNGISDEDLEAQYNALLNSPDKDVSQNTMLTYPTFQMYKEDYPRDAVYSGTAKDPCITIDSGQQNSGCDGARKYETKPVAASSKGHPTRVSTLAVSVQKPFSWGGNVNASLSTKFNSKNGISGLPATQMQAGSIYDPIMRGSRFRWTSSLSSGFFTPLPYTKGFGTYGNTDSVNYLVAKKGLESSRHSVKSSVNDLLTQVDAAYWEVVRSLDRLFITIEHRKNMAEIRKSTLRRFNKGLTTLYSKHQVEANFQKLKNLEEIAWNQYILNSNNLAYMMKYQEEVVIIPAGFTEILQQSYEVNADGALADAMQSNPDLRALQAALESSSIQVRNRENQVKPDISFSFSYSISQTDAILGYRDFNRSMGNLFSPDSTDYFVGLTYKLPIGNVAAKSALSKARISKQQTMDQLTKAQNQIIHDINIAANDALSTQSRIYLAKESFKLAKLAYDSTFSSNGDLRVTVFEQLQKHDDILEAKRAYIDAVIDHKKAEARYLSAQGILGSTP